MNEWQLPPIAHESRQPPPPQAVWESIHPRPASNSTTPPTTAAGSNKQSDQAAQDQRVANNQRASNWGAHPSTSRAEWQLPPIAHESRQSVQPPPALPLPSDPTTPPISAETVENEQQLAAEVPAPTAAGMLIILNEKPQIPTC